MRYLWLLCCLAAVSAASAATYQWTGLAGDGRYETGANWVGGAVPPNDGTATLYFNDNGTTFVSLPPVVFVSDIQFQAHNRGVTLSSNLLTLLTVKNGLTVAGGANRIGANVAVALTGNETFAVNNGSLQIDGIVAGNAAVTKAGAGNLTLSGANLFNGGVLASAGTVTATNSLSLGLGTLRMAGGTLAISAFKDLTFANAVAIDATAVLQNFHGRTVTFSGTVTIDAGVALQANGTAPYVFTGAIGESGGARKLTVSGLAPVVLAGTSQYSGGTSVAGGTLIFATRQSVPTAGLVEANYAGYVGAGFTTAVQSTLISRLNPATFAGTLGLDTAMGAGAPAVFAETLDVSGLTHLGGLGSNTQARLTGNLVVAAGADYRFGGGGGTLYVESNLTGTGRNLQLNSDWGRPLELVLRGNNSFTGQANVWNSVLVLDSANAITGTRPLNLTGPGYIGYTEHFGGTPNAFLGRIGQIASVNSIVGLDSADAGNPRTVNDNIDLSLGGTIANAYYLGTSSKVILTGTITPAAGQNLYLTAVKGGDLIIKSVLGSAIPAVVVGQAQSFDPQAGTVELVGANRYAGGTRVLGGTLLASNNAALGLGGVQVSRGGTLAVNSGVTLANPLSLNAGARLSGQGALAAPGGVTVAGGAILSPGGQYTLGTLTFNTGLTLGGGAVIEFDVGPGSGGSLFATDKINVVGNLSLASATSSVTIALNSLSADGTQGLLMNFDSSRAYSWLLADASSITGFYAGSFTFDLSGFANNLGNGSFFLSRDGNNLMVNFTPVPEPATLVLLGLGVVIVGVWQRRRFRR